MEKEGLVRSLNFLEDSGVTGTSIVTDRHPQIQKFLREEMDYMVHYYDVWHISKSKYIMATGVNHNATYSRHYDTCIMNL